MSINDGPAIPQGGQRTILIAQGGEVPELHAAPIYPEPDATEVADVVNPPGVGGPGFQYLTPDAMMIYCQSRLNGIDTQCREIMSKQEKNTKAQAALGE